MNSDQHHFYFIEIEELFLNFSNSYRRSKNKWKYQKIFHNWSEFFEMATVEYLDLYIWGVSKRGLLLVITKIL